jgi:DNA-binding transcriptional ArsR family regulator
MLPFFRQALGVFDCRPAARHTGERRRRQAMNIGTSRYDAELQMFADEPRELNLNRLRFLRWLAEHGRLEHRAESEPIGPYALTAAILEEPLPAA